MPDSLYDRDIVRWSEDQAEFLRRLAAGERVNMDLDFENIVEEIEGVGRSQVNAVRSNLKRAVEHLLKIAMFPQGPVAHWGGEVRAFLDDAGDAYTPSMRGRLDLDRVYAVALGRIAALADQGYGPFAPVPSANPFSLADLLPAAGAPVDVPGLLSQLREPGRAG